MKCSKSRQDDDPGYMMRKGEKSECRVPMQIFQGETFQARLE